MQNLHLIKQHAQHPVTNKMNKSKKIVNPTDSASEEPEHRPSNFKVVPASLVDIPEMVTVWFAAFNSRTLRQMFPDTPGVRKWWEDNIRNDILHKPQQTYLKVVDTAAKGRIVGYAKWDLGTMEERGSRTLPFTDKMDQAACGRFFDNMDRERRRLVGNRRHYFLDMLATHPDYQGKGAGNMLVRWGCALADKDRVPTYLDASKAGKRLYEKFGFEDRGDPAYCKDDVVSMVRDVE